MKNAVCEHHQYLDQIFRDLTINGTIQEATKKRHMKRDLHAWHTIAKTKKRMSTNTHLMEKISEIEATHIAFHQSLNNYEGNPIDQNNLENVVSFYEQTIIPLAKTLFIQFSSFSEVLKSHDSTIISTTDK